MTGSPQTGGPQTGFRSLDQELSSVQLAVEGKFPSWLAGALLRIGPAKFEAGSHDYRHWFDGLAIDLPRAFRTADLR
jgi:beta,beta-carotene 9',10'-dioxygenase